MTEGRSPDTASSPARDAVRDLLGNDPQIEAESAVLEVFELAGEAMPLPYRDLLVHERDMTHELQAFLGQTIHIRPLHVEQRDDTLERRVLLIGDDDGTVIELGAIRIHLNPFAPEARKEILGCRTPLGAILKQHAVDYHCRPVCYFRLEGSTFLHDIFQVNVHTTLYGRVNRILDGGGALLAEVAEVLPPLPPAR